MKPIFAKEKSFLEKKLGVSIPDNCWRSGSKIYVNHFSKKPFITFKVDLMNDAIVLKKHIETNEKNYSLEEEYEIAKDVLEDKVIHSIKQTKEAIINNMNCDKMFVSISGGKDSDVMKSIVDIAFSELESDGYTFEKDEFGRAYKLIAFNTSNDSAETYKHLKQHHQMNCSNIISPKVGFYNWIKDTKNYFTPSKLVRNCCSTYKEGQLKTIMDKDEYTVTFLGMRSPESKKRSHYKFDLNESQKELGIKLNAPDNWKRYLPIVEWTDAEVWLYILSRKMKYNEMYNLGFSRVGCLICPYQQDYVDLLIREFYPKQNKRWFEILKKNHEIYCVQDNLKWSYEEWSKGGRWKPSTSKELELTTRKPTKERVKQLAEMKGISEDIAIKYFKKVCGCGKVLNPTEVGMFLKLMGRHENHEDNRVYKCKKCMCEMLNITQKEYKEKFIEFREQGCNLF